MKINSIELNNFRNLSSVHLSAESGVNVIYGENAQGKTNILESIFLFTGLKSFRSSKDSELVSFGKDFSRLEIGFKTSLREQYAEIKITDRRRAALNGVSLPSTTALMSKFPAALFSPGFMSLIQNGPSERRKFIDSAICQITPKYAALITEYSRPLKQRNAILKDTENIKDIKDIKT